MFQFQTPRRENLIFGFQISSNKPIGVEGGTGSHGQRDIVEAVLSNRYEIAGSGTSSLKDCHPSQSRHHISLL